MKKILLNKLTVFLGLYPFINQLKTNNAVSKTALFLVFIFIQNVAIAGGGGGGGGGCTGGTSLSCGQTVSTSTGNCVGCDPTNGNNGGGPCCYVGSDLDCDGTQDVSYSVEDTKGFTYTVPAGTPAGTSFCFTVNTTVNLQGAVFNTTQGGGLNAGHSTTDEHGSSVMGSGTFTLCTTGGAGDVLQVFIDGYAGTTGSFSFSAPACLPLPVELVSFVVIQTRRKEIMIEWETASQKNSSLFELQRSDNGTHFETIETLAAAGNSNSKLVYSIMDKAPLIGLNYYRLKMIDKNGEYAFSSIESIDFQIESEQLSVFSSGQSDKSIDLKFNSSMNLETNIAVINANGITVYEDNAITNTGLNIYKLNTESFESGLYFIIVKNKEQMLYNKFVKS